MKNFTKTLRYCFILTAACILLNAAGISYGQSLTISQNGSKPVSLKSSNGASVFVTDGKGKVISQKTPGDPRAKVKLIITFKDQPLALYKKNALMKQASISSVFSSLQNSHSSFKSSLTDIKQNLSSQSHFAYDFKITREYYKALNGVALECNSGMISRISALPMVKYVALDRAVKADETLAQSVHQINADKVQDSLGINGKGVLIGEIDTGIDYRDSALGGGLGPGFRVIGGYNFINESNKPLDDNGHGTHVAGIIGANDSQLKGVAPGVNYLAVKVLDSQGAGSSSDVIAGIEYCLDPNGNPTVDIVNMSLGSTAEPDNPIDSAVTNATAAGILFVIAAGNSGQDGFGTIGSPGTCPSALTVGACDSLNNVAFFSSEGPDPLYSVIKPEVIAPGYNIISTYLNNTTMEFSGTSMATPHVTGAAALLKQQHPGWTPAELKAAIINSSASVGAAVSPFLQGKGLVNSFGAAELGTLAEPGLIDFGSADPTLNTWIDTIQITVKNIRTTSQQISLQDIEGLPSGAGLKFSATSFLLAPQKDTSVTAILTVPSSVPILSSQPFAYTGSIEFASDSDKINVPFAFFKSTSLVITCDVAPYFLDIVNRETGYDDNLNLEQGVMKYIVSVPGGSVEILAGMEKDTLGFKNYYFIDHPNINTTGVTYVNLSSQEAAINVFADSLYDNNNNLIKIDSTSQEEMFAELESFPGNGKAFGVVTIFEQLTSKDQIYFTPLDSGFYFQKSMVVPNDTEIYFLNRHKNGLASRQDAVFQTGSNNLIGFGFKCDYKNPLFENSNYSKGIQANFRVWRSFLGAQEYEIDNLAVPYFPEGLCYFNKEDEISLPNQYTSTYLCVGYKYLGSNPTEPDFGTVLRTPEFVRNDSGQVQFVQKMISQASEAIQSTVFNIAHLNPGGTFSLANNSFINFPEYITYLQGDSLYMISNGFGGPLNYAFNDGGTRESNGLYVETAIFAPTWYAPLFGEQVFSHNRLQKKVEVGAAYPNTSAYYIYKNLKENSGVYQILANASPYTLLGQSGQCTADFKYQMPALSNWPQITAAYFPAVSLFQVLANGQPAQWVQTGQPGQIRLILYDPNRNIDSVTILLLLPSGEKISLPVTTLSTQLAVLVEYDAALPTNLPAGFIDAVLLVKDVNGNKVEMTAAPAFYYGSTMNNVQFDSRVRMSSFSLNNANSVKFNAGDTLNYTLSYFNYGNNTARNIKVTFPSTSYFTTVGSQVFTLDSLNANDTAHIPVKLLFNGNQQSSAEQTDYSPSLSWVSGATTYQRENYLFVDFENVITGVARSGNTIPGKFALYQNYPNPFNPSTTIKYDIPSTSHVTLNVYNILGQVVAKLVDQMQTAGSYTVSWNGTAHGSAASGVCFLRIHAGDYVKTVKMLFLK